MNSVTTFGLAVLALISLNSIDAAVRVARSPQFGGFSQASAQAQAGGFGGGRPPFPPRPFGPRPGGFGGGPGFGGGGFGGGGFGGGGQGGETISISKSISISRGGTASSSAGSSASGK